MDQSSASIGDVAYGSRASARLIFFNEGGARNELVRPDCRRDASYPKTSNRREISGTRNVTRKEVGNISVQGAWDDRKVTKGPAAGAPNDGGHLEIKTLRRGVRRGREGG